MNPDNPARKAALLALVAAAGIAMLACTEAARPAAAAAAAPADAGSWGGGGKPPSEPPPTSPAAKSWTISAAHFGDAVSLLSQTSNRSAPYLWDPDRRRQGGVAIGGHELPFTTTRTRPVFASDISGAEWTVTPELRTGAVVLALTAPDSCKQREPGTGRIRSAVAATAPRSMPGCRNIR